MSLYIDLNITVINIDILLTFYNLQTYSNKYYYNRPINIECYNLYKTTVIDYYSYCIMVNNPETVCLNFNIYRRQHFQKIICLKFYYKKMGGSQL